MIEHHIDIDTADGAMQTFIVHPDEEGPHPVVLFLMDAPGMREELHDMCRRIASTGYWVAAPHLYYREVDGFNVFETEDRDRMFELMGTLNAAMIADDAAAVFGVADADEAAISTSVGVVGYCMSGPFSLMVAAAHNDRVKAAASMYGVRLAVEADDSPHRHLAAMTGEIYVGCAETDVYAPPEMIADFEATMKAAGTNGRIEWYPGTEHGFAFRERPIYDKPASERHWQRLHSLFRRNL